MRSTEIVNTAFPALGITVGPTFGRKKIALTIDEGARHRVVAYFRDQESADLFIQAISVITGAERQTVDDRVEAAEEDQGGAVQVPLA